MVQIGRVTSDQELSMIKELQNANLRGNLSDDVKAKEGFVTADYSIDFLRHIHSICPSIIAKNDAGVVIGYVLVVTKEACPEHPLLADFCNSVMPLQYKGRALCDTNLILVGQACIALGYRGQGLFEMMYSFYRECLSKEYVCAVTDVATNNPRSLKAHQKVGFEVIHSIPYDGIEWQIILWDWTK